jgi:hypothetical protein
VIWFRKLFFVAVAALAVGLLSPGCRWMNTVGGRKISIVFRNAEEVKTGSVVYVAGVEVGATSGSQVLKGRATVTAELYRQQKNSVAAGTVFLVGPDARRPGENCLTGYAASLSPDASKSDEVFYGASNRLELVGLIGLDKVKRLADQLTK